ncbi:MAG: purine-nucleoside phosphorylase [Tractidigestivibacter sp.]|jgi:purine-nucleoside phosphorylase|uniref:purine-nucleoside phosphorylase n=1 Tax=Tractidigestivibacter sp. TaxID=2847320 RepID=UPI003D9186BA
MAQFESASACIRCNKEDVANVVLMPGDPLRAKFIAETYLENPVLFNDVRNMLGYTGTYKGKRISVMGSGMGIPSMCLYAHELYTQIGVDAIIRVGTTGGLPEDLHTGDIVIAMSAATNSNIAALYDSPVKLAPTADWGMLKDAVNSCEELGYSYRVGQVVSSDVFYNPREDAPVRYKDLGLLCVEMETAGLYIEAQTSHKKAVSVLSVSDTFFTGESLTAEEREKSFTQMMEVSLETAWKNAE